MADNLLKSMAVQRVNSAVLVTGGYHSSGMTERLRQAGVTVVSFTPKIEKVETVQGSAYLSVFTQEKTPLEKLFHGQKLFLASDVCEGLKTNIVDPLVIAAAVESEVRQAQGKKAVEEWNSGQWRQDLKNHTDRILEEFHRMVEQALGPGHSIPLDFNYTLDDVRAENDTIVVHLTFSAAGRPFHVSYTARIDARGDLTVETREGSSFLETIQGIAQSAAGPMVDVVKSQVAQIRSLIPGAGTTGFAAAVLETVVGLFRNPPVKDAAVLNSHPINDRRNEVHGLPAMITQIVHLHMLQWAAALDQIHQLNPISRRNHHPFESALHGLINRIVEGDRLNLFASVLQSNEQDITFDLVASYVRDHQDLGLEAALEATRRDLLELTGLRTEVVLRRVQAVMEEKLQEIVMIHPHLRPDADGFVQALGLLSAAFAEEKAYSRESVTASLAKMGTDIQSFKRLYASLWDVAGIPVIVGIHANPKGRAGGRKLDAHEVSEKAQEGASLFQAIARWRPETIATSLHRLTAASNHHGPISQFVKQILITYHEAGTKKDVFQVTFIMEDNSMAQATLVALKVGKMEEGELDALKELSDRGSKRVPKFGDSGTLWRGRDGEWKAATTLATDRPVEFFLEEFIEGPTAMEVWQNPENRKKLGPYLLDIVAAVFDIRRSMEQSKFHQALVPQDLNPTNFIFGPLAILVDLGVLKELTPGEILRQLIKHFVYTKINRRDIFTEEIKSSLMRDLFDSVLHVLGRQEGSAFLRAALGEQKNDGPGSLRDQPGAAHQMVDYLDNLKTPPARVHGLPHLAARLEHTAAADLDIYEVEYGFLPPGNEIVRYVDGLLDRLISVKDGDERPTFNVLATTGAGLNAWVYANGHIVITPELLKACQNEEELIFVILHELMHWRRQHMERIKKWNPSYGRLLGLQRYDEYEADTAAFLKMEERGINPYGAIQFINQRRQEKAGYGMTHGTDTDRSLNLQSITYAMDMKDFSSSLTPIPTQVRDEISILKRSLKPLERLGRTGKIAAEVIARADWPHLHYFFQKVLFGDKRQIFKSQEAAQKLWERYYALFRERFPLLNDDPATDTAHFIIVCLVFGVDVNALFKSLEGENRLPAARLSYAAADIEFLQDFSRLLKTGGFLEGVGIYYPSRRLENIVLGLLSHMRSEGTFENENGLFDYGSYLNHAKAFLNDASSFDEQYGSSPWDEKRVWSGIILGGIGELMLNGQQGDVPGMVEQSLQNTRGQISTEDLIGALPSYSGLNMAQREWVGQYLTSLVPKPTLIGRNENQTNILTCLATQGEVGEAWPVTATWDDQREAFAIFLAAYPGKTAELSKDLLLELINDIEDDLKEDGIVAGKLQGLCEIAQLFLSPEDFSEFIGKFSEWTKIARDYSLDDFDLLNETLKDPSRASRKYNISPSFSIPPSSLEEIPEWHEMEFRVFLGEALAINDENQFFELLERFLKRRRLVDLSNFSKNDLIQYLKYELAFRDYEFGLRGYQTRIQDLLAKGRGWVDANSKDAKTLYRLYLLAFFMENPSQRAHVQAYILLELVEQMRFEEVFDLLMNRFPENRTAGIASAVEHLIEHKAETMGDMALLFRRVQEVLDISHIATQEAMGGVVLADAGMEKLFKKKGDLLALLLSSERDDADLTKYIFDQWIQLYFGVMNLEGIAHVSEDKLKEWTEDDPEELLELQLGGEFVSRGRGKESLILRPWAIRNAFYQMTDVQRYALLRKLLMSEKDGVLHSVSERKRLLRELMHTYVDENGSPVRSILESVLNVLVEKATADQLYFVFSSLLLPRFSNSPEHPTSFDDIMKEYARDLIFKIYGHFLGDEDVYSADVDEESIPYLKELEEYYLSGKDSAEDEEEATSRDDNRLDAIEAYHAILKRLRAFARQNIDTNTLFDLVPGGFYSRRHEKMTEMQFVLEIARNMGAPGVRFLQLLGQFVDLPSEYQKAFSEVYDSMKGQSRLTAVETIKRRTPSLYRAIRKISPRIGGGSMQTVYRDEVEENGVTRGEVVKVQNPNTAFRSEEVLDLLSLVLEDLAKHDPRFRPALPLIQDLREWIHGELNDPTFPADDQKFYKANHQKRPESGFRYRIIVPQTFPTEDPLVRREEYIEGTSLTALGSLPPTDQQEIISVIVRNFFSQLKAGLVHSNVNMGNFRITPNHAVALLDRGFYLKFSLQDRLFFRSVANAKTTIEASAFWVDYILRQPENKNLSEVAERKMAALKEVAEWGNLPTEELATKTVVAVRAQGIHVPLRFTLLLIDLNALVQMAKEVGFGNIKEALTYNPKKGGTTPSTLAWFWQMLPGEKNPLNDILNRAPWESATLTMAMGGIVSAYSLGFLPAMVLGLVPAIAALLGYSHRWGTYGKDHWGRLSYIEGAAVATQAAATAVRWALWTAVFGGLLFLVGQAVPAEYLRTALGDATLLGGMGAHWTHKESNVRWVVSQLEGLTPDQKKIAQDILHNMDSRTSRLGLAELEQLVQKTAESFASEAGAVNLQTPNSVVWGISGKGVQFLFLDSRSAKDPMKIAGAKQLLSKRSNLFVVTNSNELANGIGDRVLFAPEAFYPVVSLNGEDVLEGVDLGRLQSRLIHFSAGGELNFLHTPTLQLDSRNVTDDTISSAASNAWVVLVEKLMAFSEKTVNWQNVFEVFRSIGKFA